MRILFVVLALVACGKSAKDTGGAGSDTAPKGTGMYPAYDVASSKWGYIDNTGEWVLKPAYWAAGVFRDKRAAVQPASVDTTFGFIDETGKLVIPAMFGADNDFNAKVARFKDGYFIGSRAKDNVRVVIDTTGKVTFEEPKDASLYGQVTENAIVLCMPKIGTKEDHKCTHVDPTGKQLYEPILANTIGPFSGGLAIIKDPEFKAGFIDKSGKLVIPANYAGDVSQDFAEGLALVSPEENKCVFIDKTGKVAIAGPFRCRGTGSFENGTAAATTLDGTSSCIDKSGKKPSSCRHLDDGTLGYRLEYGKVKLVDASDTVKLEVKLSDKPDLVHEAFLGYGTFEAGMWRFDVVAEDNAHRISSTHWVSPKGEIFDSSRGKITR